MSFFSYVKNRIDVVYQYKLQRLLNRLMSLFTKHRPLIDAIIIESHNDFDYNGGAFYDYLIEHGYNKKYKIVWMLKHKCKKVLPDNVISFQLYRPSIAKAYYLCLSKYLFADNNMMPKHRSNQISVYCSHGTVGLKNIKGKIIIPKNIDYCLCPSDYFKPIMSDQLMLPYPNDMLICLGFPAYDLLYQPPNGELKKFVKKSYDKVVLWMPTFRKGGGFQRNDSNAELPLGIPIINTIEEYDSLNKQLEEHNILLVIKIHPMQDKDTIKINDRSNICVLTGESVKSLDIDVMRLMRESDALISDYSSAAYDYLHLNRPVGFVLSDADDYKLGFIVEDPHTLMAGHEIDSLDDMINFLMDVSEGNDVFKEKREKLFDLLFKYHDGNSCKRIIDYFKI